MLIAMTATEWGVRYVPVCVAALLAGAINALAGGGTLLTFPALMAVLTGNQAGVLANATSTMALAPASFSSAWGYRQEVGKVSSWLWFLLIPSIVGGVAGALLMTQLSPKLFNALVPWLILGATVLFTAQPSINRFLQRRRGYKVSSEQDEESGRITPQQLSPAYLVLAMVFQLFVGLYGGYFGAGIGIMMLSSLGLMKTGNLHEMNALKTILAGGINAVSIVVFIAQGVVVWDLAIAMTLASVVGGYYGAQYGRKLPTAFVRSVVIAVGFIVSAYYFAKQFQLIT
ncbi:MAG: sulfite exporter TauE/SafE family protein [Planctomycetaceae bacterium]